jgi:hypothetical protein
MNRVKTVLSGRRLASAAVTGKTLSIHGLGQGPSAEKIRCMSTQRWTPRSVKEEAGADRSPHLRDDASWPAIETASQTPCVSSARARGDTWESVPRDGSASSSPTILKLCSRPSSRRSVTDMPKDALLLSSEALTTSVLARRALSSGFLARPLQRRSCRRSLAPRGAQLQNG